jgi:hypothetical protein
MSLNKVVTGLIILAANEATYGQGAALTGSANTIQVAEAFPIFNVDYSFDGDRKGGNYSGGNNRRTTPSGRSVTGKLIIEGKGLGSTYSSVAVTPPNLHPFLISSGLSGSLQGGAWVYKPNPLGTTAVGTALEVYDRGEKLPISGAFFNMTFASPGPGITTFEFDLMGIPGTITDVATPPARIFTAASVLPPKNELVSLTIDSYATASVRSYTYVHKQDIAPRINLNSSGSFAGYALGRRSPTFTVTMEADALGAYNPYLDQQNGIARNVSFTVGQPGTNNNFTVTFPSASISKVTRKNDGTTLALWDVEFAPAISAPDQSDDMSLTFGS